MKRLLVVLFSVSLILINASLYSAQVLKVPTKLTYKGPPFVKGEILVKYKKTATIRQILELNKKYNAEILDTIEPIDWYVLKLPEGMDEVSAVYYLKDEDLVENACLDIYLEPKEWEPNDWFYTQGHLWNLREIRMPEAWDLDHTPPNYGGDPRIVVAVIDSGCQFMDYTDDYTYGFTVHFCQAPDLSQTNFWTNQAEQNGTEGVDDDGNGYIDDVHGWDFTGPLYDNGDPYPIDDLRSPHGTHVTGTIAQSTNNEAQSGPYPSDYSGVGIAFNCSIMPLKVLDRYSQGARIRDVANAIIYAADNGAHVINMSLGSSGMGTGNASFEDTGPEYDAVKYAYQHGVTIVAATGNEADTQDWSCENVGVSYPAGFMEVIGVGATDSPYPGQPYSETRATFSNYGYGVEVVAPSGQYHQNGNDKDNSGRDDFIFQQVAKMKNFNEGEICEFKFAGYQGTSMASPHVAALAALIQSYSLCNDGVLLTPDEVRCKIDYSAFDINNLTLPGYDLEVGFGRIDAYEAILAEPKPFFVVRGYYYDDSEGNNNYRAEPGETVKFYIKLKPILAGASNINVTINTSDSHITISDNSAHYPNTEFNNLAVNTNDPFVFTVAQNCPVNYLVQIDINITCAETTPQSFTYGFVVNKPNILVVDDDRNRGVGDEVGDYCHYLTDALDAAGIQYHYITTKPQNICFGVPSYPFELPPNRLHIPSYEELRGYDIVLWLMGRTGWLKKEVRETYVELWTQFLNNGGRLFLTGHEYLYKMFGSHDPDEYPDYDYWDVPTDNFVYQYFHITALEHDEYYYEVHGVSGDPITDGLNFQLEDIYSEDPSGSDAYKFDWWPDEFLVDETVASPIFNAGPKRTDYPDTDLNDDTPDVIVQGPCALRYPADESEVPPYRVVFFAFPFESIVDGSGNNTKAELIRRIVNFLSRPTNPNPPNEEVTMEFEMPASEYHPGDTFYLNATINNGTSNDLINVNVVVLLDIGIGEYWFWPSWAHYPPDIDYYRDSINAGQTKPYTIIPEFAWPSGAGSAEGIYFYGAVLNSELTELISNLASVEFSFYEP